MTGATVGQAARLDEADDFRSRLIAAAGGLLAVIDRQDVRILLLDAGLYEAAATLKDAIDACRVPQGEPVLGSLADPADLVLENYGDGYAFFRR